MIILGIDPGTATVGFGLVRKELGRLELVDFGVVRTPSTLSDERRLQSIYEEVVGLIEKHRPEHMATEKLLFGANRKTAVQVARSIGVVMLAAAQHHLEWFEYSPAEVKQAVTGYGQAEKHQVQYMVAKLLRLDAPPKPDDAADALAICLCHERLVRLPIR